MKKHIALITGGTGGIGTAICKELASQDIIVVANYFPAEKPQAENEESISKYIYSSS
jgi:acetoacetyl-CoA reductase